MYKFGMQDPVRKERGKETPAQSDQGECIALASRRGALQALGEQGKSY